MRLVVAVLFAGNMTFTASRDGESCSLDQTDASFKAAALLGVSFEDLAASLTSRTILAGNEIVHKPLHIDESTKACEALIKAVYGAAFDFIVEKVNESIVEDTTNQMDTRLPRLVFWISLVLKRFRQTTLSKFVSITRTRHSNSNSTSMYSSLSRKSTRRKAFFGSLSPFPTIRMYWISLIKSTLVSSPCWTSSASFQRVTIKSILDTSMPDATSTTDSMQLLLNASTTSLVLSTMLDTWSTRRTIGWRRIRISFLPHLLNCLHRRTLDSFLRFKSM